MTTARSGTDKRVEAAPEKLFFISMLTKDIELLPSIADLVDNSVDGARSLEMSGNFTRFFVDIRIDGKEFSISDNCGGITVDTARRYAFRFGRPEGFKGVESSVGQFGVGMKRALFKLGDRFTIESTTGSSWFKLAVNVPQWAQDRNSDWSFEFDDYNDQETHRPEDCGTTIAVTSLHPAVSQDLSQSGVIGRLAAQLSLQHQSAIVGGLRISINNKRLRPNVPSLLSSSELKPINYTIRIPVPGGGEVEARIVAGIAAAKERDDRKDEADPDDFLDPPEAGWYVFCNDRLVLAADRTALTGWGRVMAAYHPQYRRFRGYAYLFAKSSELLPWNTTKTSLDQDSPIWRTVQLEMSKALVEVAAVINRQKAEVQQTEEEEEEGPITAALNQARAVNVTALGSSERYIAPPPPPKKPVRRSRSNVVSIQYSVDRTVLERVLDATNLGSASQVGKVSFEYFVRHEMPEADE